MTRVYVATKWENRGSAREAMDAICQRGHIVTYDWTTAEQETADQALRDVAGVRHADVLVVLANRDWAFKGTYVELGIALAENLKVFIVGPYLNTMFDQMPNVTRVESLDDVLSKISRPLHPS